MAVGLLLRSSLRRMPSLLSKSTGTSAPAPAAWAVSVMRARSSHHKTLTPSEDKMNMDKSSKADIRQRSAITNALWRARNAPTADNANAERQILERKMEDSYTEALLPFSTDKELRNEYLTSFGTIRVGKILEDLDALAGTIAYRHCDDHEDMTPPLTIVTASVDRIDLMQKLQPNRDYRLSGHVSHVGNSSMEIYVTVDTPKARTFAPSLVGELKEEQWEKAMVALFTMVARDPETRQAAKINRLKPTNDAEQRLFEQGEERRKERKTSEAQSLMRTPPTEQERLVIHDLFLKTRQYKDKPLPANMRWMASTGRESVRMCHPQEQNIHGSIFGGFLMREAFEVAWVTAASLCKAHPFFLAVDDISFRSPVEVGSILKFSSQVNYAPGGDCKTMQVAVTADVIDVTTGDQRTTNVFNFTFCAPDADIPHVLPRTYEDSISYLDGARKLNKSRKVSEGMKSPFMKYYGPKQE